MDSKEVLSTNQKKILTLQNGELYYQARKVIKKEMEELNNSNPFEFNSYDEISIENLVNKADIDIKEHTDRNNKNLISSFFNPKSYPLLLSEIGINNEGLNSISVESPSTKKRKTSDKPDDETMQNNKGCHYSAAEYNSCEYVYLDTLLPADSSKEVINFQRRFMLEDRQVISRKSIYTYVKFIEAETKILVTRRQNSEISIKDGEFYLGNTKLKPINADDQDYILREKDKKEPINRNLDFSGETINAEDYRLATHYYCDNYYPVPAGVALTKKGILSYHNDQQVLTRKGLLNREFYFLETCQNVDSEDMNELNCADGELFVNNERVIHIPTNITNLATAKKFCRDNNIPTAIQLEDYSKESLSKCLYYFLENYHPVPADATIIKIDRHPYAYGKQLITKAKLIDKGKLIYKEASKDIELTISEKKQLSFFDGNLLFNDKIVVAKNGDTSEVDYQIMSQKIDLDRVADLLDVNFQQITNLETIEHRTKGINTHSFFGGDNQTNSNDEQSKQPHGRQAPKM